MRIGKKIIVFITGFCIPALVLVSYCLGIWFDHKVEQFREHSIERQLTSIQAQFDRDIARLAFFTQVYAVPFVQLDNLGRAELQRAWPDSKLSASLSLYVVSSGRVRALMPMADADSNAILPLILSTLAAAAPTAKPEVQAGLLVVQGRVCIAALTTTAKDEYVVVVRLLPQDLTRLYGQSQWISGITQAAIPAKPAKGISRTLQLPGLLNGTPLQLEVRFSGLPFAQVKLGLDFVTLVILLLGIAIVTLGYFWLKKGLLSPFKDLMQQLDHIDPAAKDYTPVVASGGAELVILADRVNTLLAGSFQHRERAKITLESISDAVLLTDVWARTVYLNPQAERLFGLSCAEATGATVAALLRSDDKINETLFAFMHGGATEPLQTKMKLPMAVPRVMARNISNLRNHQGQVIGTVILLRDITQEEVLKQQLRRRANFDPITGLPSRMAFEARLADFSAKAGNIAVCYLDLEQFKLINDNCGHNAGDRMLAMVAKAMQACLSRHELLARLGGDEFGLVIINRSALEVAQLLKHLLSQVVLQVLQDKGRHYKVGLSIGVAFGRAPQIRANELLKDADIACIAAKRKGSNQIHFYDAKDKELAYQRNAPKWAIRISQAIQNNELLLYYQTIESLMPGRARKRMEILLRIQEPSGQILPPAQFIAAAERFKLMPEVDKEVIRKSFQWLSRHSEFWDDHCISINLSGNSLGAEGMVEYIANQLRLFAIPSACICFEITETTAIQNQQRALEMLHRLRKLGFSFALDDFGSGFASYGYLRELPVDYVKIDGCFVRQLASNAKDYAIVKSIHDVCRVMGIETVAEFVENQAILDKLHSIGVDYAQGYGIGRPKPLESYSLGSIYAAPLSA
ncbi:putative bifunctional diguanylate cyclase/phosphodiesterase [Shewanella salipaludis]|uniref:EAL domain-containing protein n=1 Tax=Shewanella salipaludis TaxID=2723052 RepID=A0A972G165_9GAMM|nr:EAL domain-containing protein [Shewanella salipaludis]NMH66943.1 EAL domain-containing protein [Shewanella salipaludis]